MRIYLEYSDGKSNKFWEGAVEGSTLTTRWGRLGTEGQTKVAELADESKAQAALDKKAKAKIKKGYVEAKAVTPAKSKPKPKPKAKAAPDTEPETIVAKALAPVELEGQTIALSDYPKVFAFNEDGSRLAGVGISSVHFVDVAEAAWTKTAKTNEARTLHWIGDDLVVGTKTLKLIDGERGKKLASFKGHKACANAIVHDAQRIYTGGGNYIYSDDRFVRAFSRETGELVWKAKPGKGAGAISIALVGEQLCVAAEDGWVRVFATDDGALVGEVEIGPRVTHGSIFGGVVACGPSRSVVAAGIEGACVLTWIEHEPSPHPIARLVVPFAKLGADKGKVQPQTPLLACGRMLVPTLYFSKDSGHSALLEVDLDTRALLGIHHLRDLGDTRSCALSSTGMLAWATHGGVALAQLFGEPKPKPKPKPKSKSKSKSKSKPKPKSKPKSKSKSKSKVVELGEPIGVSGNGYARRSAFEGDLSKEPEVLWARPEYEGSAGEWGGSVCAGEGMVLGCHGSQLVALAADGGETSWSTRYAKGQAWPKSAFAMGAEAVFMASNKGLHAFDPSSGELLWTAKLPGAEGAPLVFEHVCILGANKGLHARSLAKKGRKLWAYEVRDRVVGVPAYAAGVFYFYADTQLMALDATTRELRWSLPAFTPSRAAPIVGDTQLIIMPAYGSIAALDLETGEQRWRVDGTESFGDTPMALAQGRVVLRDGKGRLRAYAVDDGAELWISDAGRTSPYGIGSAGPIVVGDTVVCVTVEDSMSSPRYLSGLELASGEVRWELGNAKPQEAMAAEQERVGSSFEGSWSWYCTPTYAEGILYAQVDGGIVALR